MFLRGCHPSCRWTRSEKSTLLDVARPCRGGKGTRSCTSLAKSLPHRSGTQNVLRPIPAAFPLRMEISLPRSQIRRLPTSWSSIQFKLFNPTSSMAVPVALHRFALLQQLSFALPRNVQSYPCKMPFQRWRDCLTLPLNISGGCRLHLKATDTREFRFLLRAVKNRYGPTDGLL